MRSFVAFRLPTLSDRRRGLRLAALILAAGIVLSASAIALAAGGVPPRGEGAAAAADSLILDYDLRQGSGTTVTDSANGIVGTTHGTLWSTDPDGQPVLDFDNPIKYTFGDGDYFEIPDHDALDSASFSVEVVVYPKSCGYYTVFLERIAEGETFRPSMVLGLSDTGYTTGQRPRFGIRVGGQSKSVVSPTEIPLNAWSHIVGTYDGADLDLYVDGELVATEAGVGGPRDTGLKPLYLGHAPTSNHYFNGYYAEFRMYSEALTAGEVAALSNTPPVAVDDTYAAAFQTTLAVDAPGVLANDDDADDDELAAELESAPSDGTLDLAADGSFTYTPDPGFSGDDTFAYRASDGIEVSEAATVTVSVSEGGHITGTVTDAGGTPLAGINVNALIADGYWWMGPVGNGMTAADGTYDITDLPAETYRVSFGGWETPDYITEYYNDASFFETATDIDVAESATVSGIDAVLASPAGYVTGTVTNGAGDPLPDITVLAYAYESSGATWTQFGWNMTFTAADGTYEIGGLPTGDYRISFWDDAGVYLPETYDDSTDVETADDVAVTAGSTTTDIDASLTLASPGHITGTVTNESDVGLANMKVSVYESDHHHHMGWAAGWTLTDGNGSYDIGGLAQDSYLVEFVDEAGFYATQYFDDIAAPTAATMVEVSAGETTSGIDAVLTNAGHITGRVTDADGVGLGVYVGAFRANGLGGWEWVNGLGSNPDGTYDIGHLPAGTYRVEFAKWFSTAVYAYQYYDGVSSPALASDVIVVAGATTPGIDAVLALAGRITGRVTDADGVGLEGISVRAHRADGTGDDWFMAEGDAVLTDADGNYEIAGGLPAGDYRVKFRDDSGSFASEWFDDKPDRDSADDVTVIAGDTATGIDASLSLASHPGFTVGPQNDSVRGEEWLADAEITITIGEGEPYDFETTAGTDGSGSFYTDTLGFDIQAGDTVTVTDGESTKTHVVIDLRDIETDVLSDTVSGYAEPGREVFVIVEPGGDSDPSRRVTADGATGAWIADFSVAVGEEPYQQAADIYPGGSGMAVQTDTDGDSTWVGWNAPDPCFNVDPQEDAVWRSIWGDEWLPDAEITVTIDGAAGPAEYTTEADDGGHFELGYLDYDIAGGDIVTVTDGETVKEHIVTALTINGVDEEAGTIWGNAEPGSEVEVVFEQPGLRRFVTADVDTGVWLADFSEAAGDWTGAGFSAIQVDEDGDSTQPKWMVPRYGPHFTVYSQSDQIHALGWPKRSHLTITVGDLGDPDFETTVETDVSGDWGPGVIGYDVVPGDLVTATDGVIVKTHVVSQLAVTGIDVDADTVSGVATPDTDVWVFVTMGMARTVIADGDGIWTADFSVAAGPEEWEQVADIRPGGDSGGAEEKDEDYDGTFVEWYAPMRGSFTIDAGAEYAASPWVQLDNAMEGAAEMRFRNEGGDWSEWEAYAETRSWTLADGDGTKAVEGEFRDLFGNVLPLSDDVVVDSTPPETTDDAPAGWVNTDTTVTLTASDDGCGVLQTQVRLDGGFWRRSTSVTVVVPGDGSNDGIHTIEYRSIDSIVNIEDTQACDVRIDTQAPQTTDNSDGLPYRVFLLEFAATDPPSAARPLAETSGAALTEYRIDGGSWKAGIAVALRPPVRHKQAGLPPGDHLVEYRSTDAAGNVETTRSCTVTLAY